MSLPNNRLAAVAAPGDLDSADSLGRPTQTIDYERGGVALGDSSQGFDVRSWRARLVGNNIVVGSLPDVAETVLTSEAGITQVTLAFDQNMRAAVAYVAASVGKLWWYDSSIPGVTTTVIGPGVKSPFLTLDDKREGFSATNDMLLFYILGNRLCYRQQRERFTVERTLAWLEGSSVTIRRLGMNSKLRLQVELAGLQAQLATGPVLGTWTAATYTISPTTSITQAMPANLATNDSLYAVLTHRSTATPPAGWTLVTSRSCVRSGLTQTMSVYRKNTTTTGDSNVSQIFSQASSGLMGLSYFAVRITQGTAPVYIGATAMNVDDLATNTVTAPIATAATSELFVMLATTINTAPAVSQPGVAAGMTVVSGQASETRLGVAVQRRKAGQTNAGRFTFDLGTPVNNGLAAITMRFSA